MLPKQLSSLTHPGIRLMGILLCTVLFSNQCWSQQHDNFIIRNVRVITTITDSSHYEVNLLVMNNKLKLVSTENLDKHKDFVVWDAKGGYLIGNLTIDREPRFVILSEDPRKNFEVMLNFDHYIQFGIEEGRIRVNKLEEDDHQHEGHKDPYSRIKWFAYSPPPFALPLNYSDGSKWNYWNKERHKGLFFAALALDRLYWLSQDEESENQVGELKSNAGGEIRGLRFGVIGKVFLLKRPWTYTVFAATNAFEKGFEDGELNNITFYDYRLDFPIFKSTLSIGKQKEPISLERVPSSLFNPMQERVSDAFLPGRNIGVQISGTMFKDRMSWAAGVFNPWLESDYSFEDSETVYMGRLTLAAYYSQATNTALHFGFAHRYSNGHRGATYGIRPEFNKSVKFLQTTIIENNSMNLSCMEAGLLLGPLWMYSEYALNQIDEINVGHVVFSSFSLTGSWVLSGERRTYRFQNGTVGPIPVAIGVNAGGKGAWELTTRFSHYDLDDSKIPFGKMQVYSLGAGWWPTSYANLTFNFRYIVNDQMGGLGHTSGLNTRILLLLN